MCLEDETQGRSAIAANPKTYFHSQKLARMNNMCGAFEYDVDPAGNTISKFWEWK